MTKQSPNDSSPASSAAESPRRRGLPLLGLALMLGALTGCANVARLFPSAAPNASADTAGEPPLQWGAPPRVPGATPAVAVPDPAYRLGPEDAIEIAVWKDDTLKSTALVRPDGGISFPLVGDLQVAGKTAAEVREEVVRRLGRFVPDPEVTVSVVRVASYRVYIIGRVNKPGDIVVGRPIDVLQALSLAGGLTPFAVEDDIRIIRRVNGKQVALPFDYTRLRKGGDLSQNITLRSGDVLLVP